MGKTCWQVVRPLNGNHATGACASPRACGAAARQVRPASRSGRPRSILPAMRPCVPNIGPRERARRLRSGLLALAGAAVLALLLGRSAVWLRATVFLPLL